MQVGGIELLPGEFDLRLRPADPASSRSLPGEVGIVALDLETTAELEAEGMARDVIRLVQRARRDAGLQVTDRIELFLAVSEEQKAVLEKWRDHIATQVLASSIEFEVYASYESGSDDGGFFTAVADLAEGRPIRIRLRRAG